jgi:hypothetical protein
VDSKGPLFRRPGEDTLKEMHSDAEMESVLQNIEKAFSSDVS